jgi:hypothetical protein
MYVCGYDTVTGRSANPEILDDSTKEGDSYKKLASSVRVGVCVSVCEATASSVFVK